MVNPPLSQTGRVDLMVFMAPKVNDRDAELDDLLSRWHAWQQGDRGVRGFNRKALVVGDSRAMRIQYGAQLERQDDEHDALRCRQTNHEVQKMADPWRSAIYVVARNLYTGREVWFSPRLPQDKSEREKCVAMARSQLTRLLVSAGVL